MWYFAGIPIVPANRIWFPIIFFFICLAFTFMLMRMFSRIFLVRSVGWDDGLMITAMCILVGQTYLIIEQIKLGLGDQVHEEHIIRSNMFVYFTVLLYTWGQWVIKMSIVAQYYRIFSTTKVRRFLQLLLIWLGVYGILNCIGPIFMCTPINRYWDTTIPGYCINYHIFHYVLSGINTVNDFVILIFPIPLLFKLRLPLRVRVILIITFSCGLFAIAVSIMRFQALVIFASGPPEQGAVLNVQITTWSSLELSVSIICGSVPSIKPLFGRCIPRLDAIFTDANVSEQYNRNQYAKSWVQLEDRRSRRVTGHAPSGDVARLPDSGPWVERSVEVRSSSDHEAGNRMEFDHPKSKFEE